MLENHTCLTIKLSDLRKNYLFLQKVVGKNVKVAGVLKSDAYGLGAEEVSKALYKQGCREFYVDDPFEGKVLRESTGKEAVIFLLKGVFKGEEDLIKKYKLIPVLNNLEQIKIWEAYAKKKNKKLPCCIHIDTGITRLGIDTEQVDSIIHDIEKSGRLEIKYIISHLACADEQENKMNEAQLEKLKKIAKKHPKYKYSFANSAGIFLSKEMHFDQVRPGICLYGGTAGLAPREKIKPVVTLTSRIINICVKDPPTTVGYGASYKVATQQKIATISLGYADGIFRCLSNKGYCCINGIKTPYIGAISMRMATIDGTSVPDKDLKIGQEVEIIGKNISLETVAKLADTINHEVLTSLGKIFCKKYK